jgi:HPt (histidine-containing phosphotransfer) domain-containing protein
MVQSFSQSITDLSEEVMLAYEQDRPESLGTVVHKFKGVCSNMGALRLADSCYQIMLHTRSGDRTGLSFEMKNFNKVVAETKKALLSL